MPTFTLAQLRQLALDRVDNNTELYTFGSFTQPYAEIDQIINEAIRIANLATGYYQTSVVVPGWSVADQLIYQTPSPILIPLRVEFNGVALDRTPVTRLAQYNPNWATETTASYGPCQEWVPFGLTLFAIHPIDSTGGNNILVTGVQDPTPLTDPDQIINLPDDFVDLISEYSGHRLVLKEGGAILAQSMALFQSWRKKLGQLSRWYGFRSPLIQVKTRQVTKIA